MPKIVDHESSAATRSRWSACRSWSRSMASSRRRSCASRGEAGYTTGMVAHYFDTKQDIVIGSAAADPAAHRGAPDPERDGAARPAGTLLTEALPVDETRYTECAFWIAFWGQVPADKRLKRINAWLHREYLRLFERCLARGLAGLGALAAATREQGAALGHYASSTASTAQHGGEPRATGPAERQIGQLRLQLELLHGWATLGVGAAALKGRQQGFRLTRSRWTLRSPKNSN